ncbi:MAG TPA: LamG-like jellyroll fold domain-containing protein, partial [Candidatus Paceibacterota bacterium]|nr:LamG-like jellyroll fold domain-containing protein [Candidatus Paceibacterota bacterium]
MTFQIQLYHHCGIGNEYYLLFPSVTTNNTSVNPADTGYFVWSSGSTANSGSHGQLYAGGGTDSGSSGYPTYDAFIQEITNRWTLQVTNATATNIYHFSVGGFPSNMLPAVSVTFPADQATEVTNLPVFAWQGPTNYPELYVQVNNTDYSFAQGTYLPPIETYWACPTALASGSNYYFGAYYNSNADATITATIPTNNLGQVFSGWESSCRMQAYGNSYFTVAGGLSGPSTGGHRLLAHYSFDDSNGIGSDNSGNANDLNGGSWWGQNHQFSTDAVAGGGAVEFHGASSLNPSDNTRTNWNLTLASSFTISAWVKTTAITGADTNDAISGAAILWAYNDIGGTNDTIPLAISGSKAAFSTRDHSGITTTLHSTNSVTDGSYHMITITRDALTGEKRIYVDGNLNGSEIGTTDRLNGNTYFLSIGGTTYASYSGILDDVQIYAGVLSADEIAALHDNPGTTTTNKPPIGLQARYDFDEGTVVAPDMSGNGNPILHAGQFSGTGSNISTDSVSGGGSIHFDGGSYLTASTNILSTLAGSFSISLWLKTDQSTGNPGDLAWDGAGIVTADSPDPGSKDLIPIALTAGQVAFNIGDGNADNTLNSTAAVNDNQWHHVVVTRNQSTGERQLFIDGVLDTSDTAS